MKRSSPYLFTINKVDVVRLLQDLYFKCTLLHTYIIMCIHGPRLKKNCRLLAKRSCAPLIYWNGAFSLKLVHEFSSEVLNSHKSRFCVLGVGSFSSRIAFCTKCASDESVVHQCLVLSVCACFAVLLVCLCLSCWLLCVCVYVLVHVWLAYSHRICPISKSGVFDLVWKMSSCCVLGIAAFAICAVNLLAMHNNCVSI